MGESLGESVRRVSSAMNRREVRHPNGTERNGRSVPRGTSVARQTITAAAGAVAAAARSRMPHLRRRDCLSRLYAASSSTGSTLECRRYPLEPHGAYPSCSTWNMRGVRTLRPRSDESA